MPPVTPASPGRLVRGTIVITGIGLLIVAAWFVMSSLFSDSDVPGADETATNVALDGNGRTQTDQPPATLGSNRAPLNPSTSILSGTGTSGTPTESSAPAAPNGAATDGVSCYRPLDAAGSDDGQPFVASLDASSSGPADRIVVQLALLTVEGMRRVRSVTFDAVVPGTIRVIDVPDSSDASVYLSCSITAMQRDEQLILTGR